MIDKKVLTSMKERDGGWRTWRAMNTQMGAKVSMRHTSAEINLVKNVANTGNLYIAAMITMTVIRNLTDALVIAGNITQVALTGVEVDLLVDHPEETGVIAIDVPDTPFHLYVTVIMAITGRGGRKPAHVLDHQIGPYDRKPPHQRFLNLQKQMKLIRIRWKPLLVRRPRPQLQKFKPRGGARLPLHPPWTHISHRLTIHQPILTPTVTRKMTGIKHLKPCEIVSVGNNREPNGYDPPALQRMKLRNGRRAGRKRKRTLSGEGSAKVENGIVGRWWMRVEWSIRNPNGVD